jgi:Tfp pilus assembly protein PilX
MLRLGNQRNGPHERGSALLVVMLMVLPLCAMVGLVFDVGWVYFTRESAQAAAEAAALAAVQSALDGIKLGGTYTCGSQGLGCQAATACPATISFPITSNLQNGCAYAWANGFTNGGLNGTQTVTIQAGITSPPPTVPGVDVSYWVTVRIFQRNPLTFLAVLGGQTVNVGVRATAAVIPAVEDDCLVALNPSASQAITISGSAQVTANNCAAQVASSSSDALDVSGAASLTASSIDIVGGYKGNVSPTPTQVSSVTNPYASLPAPTPTTPCTADPKFSGGTHTLSPGTYCGITMSNSNVTFNPGTYILYGGGFTQSNGTTTGAGVTFYNTCSPSPCSGGNNYKPVTISGSGSSTLSAPTSGSLTGIIFFEDPTAKALSNDSVSGNSSTCFTGVLYFPQGKLTYSGGSSGGSCNTQLVADEIVFSGSASLGSTSNNGAGPSSPIAALIE